MFLDGVGVPDPLRPGGAPSPVLAARTPTLDALRGGAQGAVYRELDANLGFDGLPQSATGQTTLLTGRNGAEAMAGHYGPWPGPTLKALLDEGNIFHDGVSAGGAALANAYPPGYFTARRGRRFGPNAIAYGAMAAGLRQRGEAEYARGEAVPSDLVGAHLERPRGPLGPTGSADVLGELASRHALTLLDVWLTDALGHARRFEEAVALLERLDLVVASLLGGSGAVTGGVTLLITSDHGNLEDLSVATHTRNPVPLYAVGPGAGEFAAAASLLDVAPAVRRVMGGTTPQPAAVGADPA